MLGLLSTQLGRWYDSCQIQPEEEKGQRCQPGYMKLQQTQACTVLLPEGDTRLSWWRLIHPTNDAELLS